MRACHVLLCAVLACAPARACAEGFEGTLDRTGLQMTGPYWYSTGRVGYNLYRDTTTAFLVSRLTYDQLTANSGEVYLRGDTPWGIFIKGYIGGGSIAGGGLVDEDFPFPGFPYSRTSSAVSGNLSYGTVDLGYSL